MLELRVRIICQHTLELELGFGFRNQITRSLAFGVRHELLDEMNRDSKCEETGGGDDERCCSELIFAHRHYWSSKR